MCVGEALDQIREELYKICSDIFFKANKIDARSKNRGMASFTLVKGHDQLHQKVILPRLSRRITDEDKKLWPEAQLLDFQREIFAKWTVQMSQQGHTYFTDANGFDLVERDVMRSGVDAFSKMMYPVDASITMVDFSKSRAFTVWNDRPQAGTVQDDSSIKLLIDRRTLQVNRNAGISERMYGFYDKNVGKLHLNFWIKVQKTEHIGTKTA